MENIRQFIYFNIVGSTYVQGVLGYPHGINSSALTDFLLINSGLVVLKVGTLFSLNYKPGKSCGRKAIAIYYGEHKFGCFPHNHNNAIIKFLERGHKPLVCHCQQLDPAARPEQQVGVVLFARGREIINA